MIIPSHSFGVVASGRPRVVAAGVDVTPNAINWTEQSSAALLSESTTETITGINTTITLRIQETNGLEIGQYVYYIKNGGSQVLINNGFPGYADVSIVSGDTLKFRFEGDGQVVSAIISITNLTDANTVLDTVTLNVTGI